MKLYRVGGSVRDELLQLPIKERDWLVVGSTYDAMQALGFMPVGKDFPVFLHPRTKEEYALARTERKSGVGYCGFVVHAAVEVTAQQDVLRRDLTINTLLVDAAGAIHDYCHGLEDIRNKCLRHVSDAFVEDPLRLLRVARFYGRFAHLGFTVASDTQRLLAQIVHAGELSALARPRIVSEFNKCLASDSPALALTLLHESYALPYVFDVPLVEQPDFTIVRTIAQVTHNQQARFIAYLLATMPIDAFCLMNTSILIKHGVSKDIARTTATAVAYFKTCCKPDIQSALVYLQATQRTEQLLPANLLATMFIAYGESQQWRKVIERSKIVQEYSDIFASLRPVSGLFAQAAAQDMQHKKQECAKRMVRQLHNLCVFE